MGCLWYERTELGGIKLQHSRQFFSGRGSLRPFKGSPRSRTSRGPLAHTFIRRNKSFSEVKNLATSLLIICQKEEIPVIFRKNRHALLTCGTEKREHFINHVAMGRARFLLCTAFIFFRFVGELNQNSTWPYSQWDFQSRNLWCLFAKSC